MKSKKSRMEIKKIYKVTYEKNDGYEYVEHIAASNVDEALRKFNENYKCKEVVRITRCLERVTM